MTDLNALRAYIALDGGTVTERTLLAEVDRLTAENGRIRSFSTASRGAEHERARILAAVEADWLDTGPWQNYNGFETNGDPYRRVIAAIKGETT